MAITVTYPGTIGATQPGVLTGTWTHTSGDAAETIEVNGTILKADFYDNDSSGPKDVNISFSTSLSGSTTTVTVYANATVTSGVFKIEYIPA